METTPKWQNKNEKKINLLNIIIEVNTKSKKNILPGVAFISLLVLFHQRKHQIQSDAFFRNESNVNICLPELLASSPVPRRYQ